MIQYVSHLLCKGILYIPTHFYYLYKVGIFFKSRFLFPNHLHNAATSTSWTIVVNVTYTRMWMPKEEDKAKDNPPDHDDDDDDDDARETISSIIERQGPSRNLYVPLQINAGLSYSCSSNEHNYYSVAYNKNGFRNGSGVFLKGIQVCYV